LKSFPDRWMAWNFFPISLISRRVNLALAGSHPAIGCVAVVGLVPGAVAASGLVPLNLSQRDASRGLWLRVG
jgi:hypothetical protein